MKIVEILLCFALVKLVHSSCSKSRVFYAYHNKNYPGPMLYKYTKATQTTTECQRMCNQILKCTGFVMRWTGTQRGYCDFFKKDPNIDLEDSDGGTTVFLNETWCPTGFTAYSKTSHCYKPDGLHVTYQEANARCTTHHKDAYLAEIQSEEENTGVRDLIVAHYGSGIEQTRLGAKRASHASDYTAFVWERSGIELNKPTTFKVWRPRSPDNDEGLLNNDRCIYGDTVETSSMSWGDSSCDLKMPFICEIDV